MSAVLFRVFSDFQVIYLFQKLQRTPFRGPPSPLPPFYIFEVINIYKKNQKEKPIFHNQPYCYCYWLNIANILPCLFCLFCLSPWHWVQQHHLHHLLHPQHLQPLPQRALTPVRLGRMGNQQANNRIPPYANILFNFRIFIKLATGLDSARFCAPEHICEL